MIRNLIKVFSEFLTFLFQIEALKMENIALKDEVEGIKFEKQSILKECISLKAQVVGHH